MRVRLLPLIALLFLLAGCTSHPIPELYRPLEELSERPWWLGGSAITTIHTTVWVRDIDDYFKRKPEGGSRYVSDMIHERIHSLRMGNIFSTGWFLLRYIFSTDFMWEEESIGWYFQITYLKSKGVTLSPAYTASFLLTYSNLTGSMLTPEGALQWAKDVYSGKWKPDITEEEWKLYYTDIVEALENAQ
jgi:hypothetical protein